MTGFNDLEVIPPHQASSSIAGIYDTQSLQAASEYPLFLQLQKNINYTTN